MRNKYKTARDSIEKNQLAADKYRAQLEALTADTPASDRMTLAQNMVVAGAAIPYAALKTGANKSELRTKMISGYVPDLNEDGIAAAEDRIVRQALNGVERVSAQLLEMAEAGHLKPPDLIRLLSVFRDTIAKKLEWGVVQPPEPPSEEEKEPTALEKLVAHLGRGESVTVSKQEEKIVTPDWWKTIPDQSDLKEKEEAE